MQLRIRLLSLRLILLYSPRMIRQRHKPIDFFPEGRRCDLQQSQLLHELMNRGENIPGSLRLCVGQKLRSLVELILGQGRIEIRDQISNFFFGIGRAGCATGILSCACCCGSFRLAGRFGACGFRFTIGRFAEGTPLR